MKNILKAYMNFTKAERYGIAGLLLVIMILLVVRVNMHRWVKPPAIDAKQVVIATRQIKEVKQQEYAQKVKALPVGKKINLNTADSLTLISLPGIGKGLSHRILKRRRELGCFANMEQVLEVYKFKQETKEMLLKHTVVE